MRPPGRPIMLLKAREHGWSERIAPHFQHHLFLTATPHNGYTESFTSLLELLDNQRFSRNIMPDEKQLSQVMVRRLKTDLVNSKGNPIYPKRRLQALSVPFTDQERSIHSTLEDYCKSREATTRHSVSIGTKFVNALLRKRLFSSPAAFASTLEKHVQTLNSKSRPSEKGVFSERHFA